MLWFDMTSGAADHVPPFSPKYLPSIIPASLQHELEKNPSLGQTPAFGLFEMNVLALFSYKIKSYIDSCELMFVYYTLWT